VKILALTCFNLAGLRDRRPETWRHRRRARSRFREHGTGWSSVLRIVPYAKSNTYPDTILTADKKSETYARKIEFTATNLV